MFEPSIGESKLSYIALRKELSNLIRLKKEKVVWKKILKLKTNVNIKLFTPQTELNHKKKLELKPNHLNR